MPHVTEPMRSLEARVLKLESRPVAIAPKSADAWAWAESVLAAGGGRQGDESVAMAAARILGMSNQEFKIWDRAEGGVIGGRNIRKIYGF